MEVEIRLACVRCPKSDDAPILEKEKEFPAGNAQWWICPMCGHRIYVGVFLK